MPTTNRFATLAVLTLVLAGCGSPARAPEAPASSRPAVTAGSDVLEAPSGTRWAGIGDLVVAVPVRWETVAGTCVSPDARQVAIQTGDAARVRCALIRPGSPAVTLSPPGSLGWSGGRGVRCRASTAGPCSARVGAGDDGFRVTYRGPDTRRELEDLLATATTLPDGWVTVPAIPYGVSDREGVGILDDAGLVGIPPDVDWPHYVIGTDPAIGSVVPTGSEVALRPGDG